MIEQPEQALDWRSIAARVAMAGGAYYLLTAPERDALEEAVDVERAVERPSDWVLQDALRQGAQLGIMQEAAGVVFGNREAAGVIFGPLGPGLSGPGGELPGEDGPRDGG